MPRVARRRRGCDVAARTGRNAGRRWLARLGGLLILAGAATAAPALAEPGAARPGGVQTASMPAAALPAQAAVLDARLGVHPDKTRFVLELLAPVPFEAFIDASRAILDLPEIAWKAHTLPAGKGLVRGVRVERAAGRLRVVLETAGPSRVALAELIPPRDGRPPRLILDLEPGPAPQTAAKVAPAPSAASAASARVGRSGFGLAVGLAETQPAPATAVTPPATQVALAVPAAVPPAPKPPAQAAPPTRVSLPGVGAVPLPGRKPTPAVLPMIVLDAGHGGQDPGAVAVNGVHEKDIALSVAREVRRQLLATGRFRVGMTRDSDIFIRLRDRVQIAREKEADLFISLHADSIGRPGVRGLSVYTLSDKASDREAELLAQRENRSDAIVGMDLSAMNQQVVDILIDLARRDTANQSRRFAGLIVDKAGPEVELLQRPIRSAGFAVLTAPDVPSVLVELGYLSHPKDAKLLVSQAHQRRLAAGIVRAIEAYFQNGPVLSRS